MSNKERKDYIDAEKCLIHKRKGQTGLEGVVSRYDDLTKVHQLQSLFIHGDGWFFPFHRLITHAHETLLREECGYKGGQPYWDETRDAGAFSKSIIFDTKHGFGGNGRASDNCVVDGPFANLHLTIGPGFDCTAHCLTRKIADSESVWAGKEHVDKCMNMKTSAEAWPCFEGGSREVTQEQLHTPPPPGDDGIPDDLTPYQTPHIAGHSGVGGEMENPISSPGDPLFWLHHGFIDQLWWKWQKKDLKKRVKDISGYTTLIEPEVGGWVPVSFDDEMDMMGVIPNATIGELMHIQEGPLCYEYV